MKYGCGYIALYLLIEYIFIYFITKFLCFCFSIGFTFWYAVGVMIILNVIEIYTKK